MNKMHAEILAPAGNTDSLKAAIYNGADAVYLGLNNFSARSKASNFSLEELKSVVRFAHLFDAKVYVAVNTLIKNNELPDAVHLIEQAHAAKADAFIIQDLGLLHEIRKVMPNITLHASTQMGIHNVYGAQAAKDLGCSRVILSREALLEDIREIHEKVDIEIETFVQGALCIAFSGNCLFSSLVSGYSGNRGKCLQLCRKKYELQIENLKSEGYYLSAKDLCMLDTLQELLQAGVSSFKIEGRMRRAEYVGESVAVYKRVLHACLQDKNYDAVTETAKLKKLYNRGNYCRGYLTAPSENVVFPFIQGHMGFKIGTVKNVENGIAKLQTTQPLVLGDGLKFVHNGKESGSCAVTDAERITFGGNVEKGDDVHITSDARQLENIKTRKSVLDARFDIELKCGAVPKVTLFLKKNVFSANGKQIVSAAKTAPLMPEQVSEVFAKTGIEYISVRETNVRMDKDVFLPIGQLKSLRREVLHLAFEELHNTYQPPLYFEKSSIMSDIIHQNFTFDCPRLLKSASYETLKLLDTSSYIDGFIYSPKNYADYDAILTIFRNCNKPIFLDSPVIARGKDLDVLKKLSETPEIKNVIANNLYALKLFAGKNILLGPMMNILNDGVPCEKIYSLESDSALPNGYYTAYCHVPMMTFSHCPYKTLKGSCGPSCKGFTGSLKDERGNEFSLYHYKVFHCYALLLNNKPLCLIDELNRKNHKKMIFDCTHLDAKQTASLISDMESGKMTPAEHIHFNFNKKLY